MQTETHTTTEPGLDTLLSLYRGMLMIRYTEEALVRLYQLGQIPGACHTYIGQEAIATGVCTNLWPEDVVFSTHRGHGHAVAKGVPPVEVIAELLGRASGCSRGRGGSMHLFAPEVGLMGTTGIVGPNILQATGAALSFQILGSDRASVCFFGDGAVNNGAFHEGINMAAIWDLPVLFVCENNMYATEVPFSYATRNTNVAERARSYGVASLAVDGNDAAAVFNAASEALEHVRSGHGPYLIECRSYRTRPHAEGMRDVGYRTKDEVAEWKERDPIAALKVSLAGDDFVSEEQFAAIEAEVKGIVEEAQLSAESSPFPDPATATSHIYSELPT